MDGRRTYDALLALLDPKLITFQFQVSTVSRGYDAAEYFTKYPGRIISMHAQDWSAASQKTVALGQGDLDWNKIFSAAEARHEKLFRRIEAGRHASQRSLFARTKRMNRRDFLIASTVASSYPGKARADTPDRAKLDRIAVMTLSFNSILKSVAHTDDPARTLDILDAPQMIADRYGIHHVEVQHSHFASTEPAYLKEVSDRLRKAKSQMNQICLEFGPLNISSSDPMLRLETIDLTKQWIEHARAVGCPRVMLNQGTLAPDVLETATATLKTIGEYGKSRKIFVTMENRGHVRPVPGAPPHRGRLPAGRS